MAKNISLKKSAIFVGLIAGAVSFGGCAQPANSSRTALSTTKPTKPAPIANPGTSTVPTTNSGTPTGNTAASGTDAVDLAINSFTYTANSPVSLTWSVPAAANSSYEVVFCSQQTSGSVTDTSPGCDVFLNVYCYGGSSCDVYPGAAMETYWPNASYPDTVTASTAGGAQTFQLNDATTGPTESLTAATGYQQLFIQAISNTDGNGSLFLSGTSK